MVKESSSLDERTGWGYVWTNSEWKRCFLVLSPGILRVFASDQRHTLEKYLLLGRSVIGIRKPFVLQDSKLSTKTLSKHVWKSLLKVVTVDQCFSQLDVAVITIKPRKGKSCLAMFPTQAEAEIWKAGVMEARSLVEENNVKVYFRAFRRSHSLQQVAGAIDSTKIFSKTNSMLKVPFGLRWEAYSPLLRLKEGVKNNPELSQPKHDAVSETDEIKHEVTPPLQQLWHDVETLQGCTDFLRSSCLNFYALEQAALMVNHFKGSYQMGDSSLPDELRLEAWKGTARRIVKSLLDQILARNSFMEACCGSDDNMDQLWLASEVWVFGAVHDKIMGACKQMFAIEDASLDNVLAKLGKVEPSKLGVRAEFESFILGEACEHFQQLNRLRTPYEKALCLQRTVRCIVDGIHRLIKSCGEGFKDTERLLPCTDDLLSFMLLLMARTKVKYLHANACYMENFLNLRGDNNRGELVYHITNFAAACSYLHSSALEELLATSESSPPRDPSHVHQLQILGNQLSFDSPCSFTDSSGGSRGSSTDVGSKHSRQLAQALTGSFSSEGLSSEESSCYDVDVYKDCRANSLHGKMEDVHQDDISCIESPLFVNIFSVPEKTWWEREDSSEDERCNGVNMSTCKKGLFALPGESPDFLLAPTYH